MRCETKAIEHSGGQRGGARGGTVGPTLIHSAYYGISRYAAERTIARGTPILAEPFTGAVIGAVGYVLMLLLVAYCAGIGLFGADWLSLGALDAGAAREWWRALTALTLHLDQEHLLGNLLFGVLAGIGAGRLPGPSAAWRSTQSAGEGGSSVG